MTLPRLYPILDIGSVEARGLAWKEVATDLLDAGVEVLQLRNKHGSPQEVLEQAQWLTAQHGAAQVSFVMNDRPDLAMLAGWHIVHLGQEDMPPEAAQQLFPSHPLSIGLSTHTGSQVAMANRSCADYLAIGPVFATQSKSDAEPAVGLEGVREARRLTTKPLVAIGGITLENAQSVIDAGADSVAVIGALLDDANGAAAAARAFFQLLR